MSNTILITGGTGFLGQHLAQRLIDDGASVTLMGRDFTSVAPSLHARVTLLHADLRDRQAVIDACAGIDAVYHAGALSAPWGKRHDFWDINVGGTAAVIEGCRVHGVRRLIYVSSPSVVFDGSDHENLTDDAPYPRRFASLYSETKKLGEDQVNTVRAMLETVIVRPKAIFGPGDRALLPRLIAAAHAGRLPQIGDGRNRVDLTYVENVAHALQCALHAPGAIGGTYTITNGDHPLLWELIGQVLEHVRLPTELPRIPLPVAQALAAGMELRAAITGTEPLLTRYTVAILARTQTYDIAHAVHDLRYTPPVTLTEGLRITLESLPG